MIYTLTLNPALDRELTVPAFAFDQVLRANAVRVDYGGKGFNVSRSGRLGRGEHSAGIRRRRNRRESDNGIRALAQPRPVSKAQPWGHGLSWRRWPGRYD